MFTNVTSTIVCPRYWESTDQVSARNSIPDRKTTFILAIGEDFYVEGQPLIYTDRYSTGVLVLLMATFYVFNSVQQEY